jgi:hypothetical protein
MGNFFDSIKEIVDTVQSGVDGVNKLKTEGKGLVSDYTKAATDMAEDLKKTVPVDEAKEALEKAQSTMKSLTDKAKS